MLYASCARAFAGAVILATAAVLAPGSAQTTSGAAIATADADAPGVRLEVQQLKRDSGGTVTLRMLMINDTSKSFDAGCHFNESGLECGTISGVALVDAANKKMYPVVRDDQKKCLCSTFPGVPAKTSLNLWAKFPAPPETVDKVSVVVPKFMPMDDVPISR